MSTLLDEVGAIALLYLEPPTQKEVTFLCGESQKAREEEDKFFWCPKEEKTGVLNIPPNRCCAQGRFC